MTLPCCGASRVMLAFVMTAFLPAFPALVRAAVEEHPPAVAGEVTPAAAVQVEGDRVKSAEERVAALEARVQKLEQELRQLRAAAQSAAAALASAAGGGDGPSIGGMSGGGDIRGSSAGSVGPARHLPQQQVAATPAPDGNHFLSLSDESKQEFLAEMRAMVESMPNATPDERADAVRNLMTRLRARDDAKKSAGSGSGSGGGSGAGAGPVSGIHATTNIGSSPTELLPTMPEVRKTPEPAQTLRATAETTASSHDATRTRFEALNTDQRNRFVQEMRNMREKLQYATPEERSVLVNEVLTKVEKEAAAAAAPATSGPASAQAPSSSAPSKGAIQPEEVKEKEKGKRK